MAKQEQRMYKNVDQVERVEYPCNSCGVGFYRYEHTKKRIETHNQIPHTCNKCGAEVYFTLPYPALRYKGRIFVDWQTVRGLTLPED